MSKEKKELSLGWIEDEVVGWRAEIIDDILTNGLQSAAALQLRGKRPIISLGSLSRDLSLHVEGRAVFPSGWSRPVYDLTGHSPDYDHFEDSPRVLYKDQFFVFPVLTERRGDRYSLMSFLNARKDEKLNEEERILTWIKNKRGLFRRRMASSFLVVCHFDESFTPLALHTNGKQEVAPTAFIFLVFPANIWDKYGNREQVSIPTKVVPGVEREIVGVPRVFVVPDYERAIEEILKERPVPIWIHGVRLPTNEDVLGSKRMN